MEQHDRSRRQQQARQAYGQQQGEGGGSDPGSTNDGFRQPGYIQQPPVSASISGRVDSTPTQVYGFASSPQYGTSGGMQPSPMQYGQGITPAEAARQQSQQYPQYGATIMYGAGAPQGTPVIPSSYEQVPPYRQRPGSGSETIGASFGVPQYYLAGQHVPTAGNVAELSTQNMPAQYPQPDTYPVTAAHAVGAFPTTAMDPSQQVPYNPYMQQAQYTPQLQLHSEEQRLDNYHLQLRNIFTLARDGALQNLGTHLLEVSQYLLGNVETLGKHYVYDRVRAYLTVEQGLLETMRLCTMDAYVFGTSSTEHGLFPCRASWIFLNKLCAMVSLSKVYSLLWMLQPSSVFPTSS